MVPVKLMPRKGEVWIQKGCRFWLRHPVWQPGEFQVFPYKDTSDYFGKDIIAEALQCGCLMRARGWRSLLRKIAHRVPVKFRETAPRRLISI